MLSCGIASPTAGAGVSSDTASPRISGQSHLNTQPVQLQGRPVHDAEQLTAVRAPGGEPDLAAEARVSLQQGDAGGHRPQDDDYACNADEMFKVA